MGGGTSFSYQGTQKFTQRGWGPGKDSWQDGQGAGLETWSPVGFILRAEPRRRGDTSCLLQTPPTTVGVDAGSSRRREKGGGAGVGAQSGDSGLWTEVFRTSTTALGRGGRLRGPDRGRTGCSWGEEPCSLTHKGPQPTRGNTCAHHGTPTGPPPLGSCLDNRTVTVALGAGGPWRWRGKGPVGTAKSGGDRVPACPAALEDTAGPGASIKTAGQSESAGGCPEPSERWPAAFNSLTGTWGPGCFPALLGNYNQGLSSS